LEGPKETIAYGGDTKGEVIGVGDIPISQNYSITNVLHIASILSISIRAVPAAHSEEDEEDDEPLCAKMARLRKEADGKKAMGSSSGARVRRKTTAGRPVRRPIDLSSGSGSDFGFDSTVPKAEEDASDSSDEE
jgi:hypothetical protein